MRPFDKLSTNGLRPTWAWLWVSLAFALLVAAAGFIAVIALSGYDQGEVALAVLLIGSRALVGVFALGLLGLMMARPSGERWKSVRRWGLALVGSAALLSGLTTVLEGGGSKGAIAFAVAGASALAFLWLDLRRGREGE